MADIKKAVITAAGLDQRTLALQNLVDRDGTIKSALQIILGEALDAGINEIAIVVHPGDQNAYRAAAGADHHRLQFVEQPEPRGYGHALYCAREFVGGEPFLHLVGDHLYVRRQPKGCAQQLVEVARTESCAVSAVQPTRERMLPYYGTVGGRRIEGKQDLYKIDIVREKPTPTEAEQYLMIPGLRAGQYLSFFGMHVLTPGLFGILERMVAQRDGPEAIQLSPALSKLAAGERYLACELAGVRYNIGEKYGLFRAQFALALEGQDREEVLAQFVELLALRG